MQQLDLNNYCRCGHTEVSHKGTPNKPLAQINGSHYCWYFANCRCKMYIQDNLKYLEKQCE